MTTEESYDLYENRFVYHLIQRLFAFVDKRTDVIFWSTGDETCDVMSMESSIDDAYEEISYKVEMKIRNRQSLVENDTDNMSIIKRIDRVRRMSRVLRSSSFCDIMNGCARVYSPIQRTNLMMKDPDYRTCYKLWQFIENYDEVGYSIEEQDSALEFDEEYLLQMYIGLITNYTVFKSLLESDPRKMSEIAQEKREPVKPKFIKEIKEEIVDDYNIPDVEVRKVIIEEVTQAQLDAEEKLAKETARREELEQSLSDLQSQLDFLNRQLEEMQDLQMQTEGEKAAAEAELDAQKHARTAAEEAAAAARAQARTEIDAARDEAKEVIDAAGVQVQQAQTEAKEQIEAAQVKAAQEMQRAKAEAKEQIEAAQIKAAQEMQRAKAEAKEQIEVAQARAAQEAAALEKEKTDALAAAEKDAENRIAALQAEAQRQIAEAQQAAEAEAERIRLEMQEQIAHSRQEAESQAAAAKEAAQAEAAQIRQSADREVQAAQAEAAQIRQSADREIQAAQAETSAAREAKKQAEAAKEAAEKNAAAAQLEAEQAEKEAKDFAKKYEAAEAAKEKAIAKAQANSLSKYLVTALRERKERKNQKEDDK